MKKQISILTSLIVLMSVLAGQPPSTGACVCTYTLPQCNSTTVVWPSTTTLTGTSTSTTSPWPTTTTILYAPVITSLEPPCLPPYNPGQSMAVLVAVYGSGFAENSVVYIDGMAVGTSYWHGGYLTAYIPSSALISIGGKSIYVRTRNKPDSNYMTLMVSAICGLYTTTTRPAATTTTASITTTSPPYLTTTTTLGNLVLRSFSPPFLPFNAGEQTIIVWGDNLPVDRIYQVWLHFGVNSAVSGGDDLYVRVVSPSQGIVIVPASYTTWEGMNGLAQDPVTGDYLVGTFLYYNLDPIHQRSDPVWFVVRASIQGR
jgi:hypothetical protein